MYLCVYFSIISGKVGPWRRDVTLHLTEEIEKEKRERDLSVGLVGLGWAWGGLGPQEIREACGCYVANCHNRQ